MGQKAKIIWDELSVYIYITIGLIIYGTGVTLFMLPYEVTSGGVTGIASLIYFATGFEVQNSYLIINAALLLAAVHRARASFAGISGWASSCSSWLFTASSFRT